MVDKTGRKRGERTGYKIFPGSRVYRVFARIRRLTHKAKVFLLWI